MNEPRNVTITHFSDVLCIWAYVAQVRTDEIKRRFGPSVAFSYRFIPVFGDTAARIGRGWQDRGGFAGYGRHVLEVAGRFEHVAVHPGVWREVRPASSAGVHLFLKAVQLWEESEGRAGGAPRGGSGAEPGGEAGETALERAAWRLRLAFFRDSRDIARADVRMAVAEELAIPAAGIEPLMRDGTAFAALCADAEAERRHRIEGSPTLVLNEGRQKLYGNVGYRVIEANVQELLRTPDLAQASWC